MSKENNIGGIGHSPKPPSQENENGEHVGRQQPANTRTGRGRIRSFPKGALDSTGFSEVGSGSESSEVRESIRSGQLSEGGTPSTSSNDKGSGRYSVAVDGTVERIDRPSEQSDRGVRNSTTNHSRDEEQQEPRRRTALPTRTRRSEGNVRDVLPRKVIETSVGDVSSDNDVPAPSILDLDSKSSLKLNHEVEIVPTKMLEREILKNQEIEVTDSRFDEAGEIESRPRGKSKAKSKGKSNVIQTPNADTLVVPAKPFKFEKETRAQLNEVIKLGSQLLDLGIDYGCGVDTSTVPIWEFSEEESEVFVRILERRAARSEIVRDKIIPKMLEGRDYLEAGMIVVPRAIATTKAIVDNGGAKPHFKPRA